MRNAFDLKQQNDSMIQKNWLIGGVARFQNEVSTHIIKIHHFKIRNVSLKEIGYQMGPQKKNICHQTWIYIQNVICLPKHLANKIWDKLFQNYKDCLKTTLKVLGKLLCNGRGCCDISQGLRHAIPWTHHNFMPSLVYSIEEPHLWCIHW